MVVIFSLSLAGCSIKNRQASGGLARPEPGEILLRQDAVSFSSVQSATNAVTRNYDEKLVLAVKHRWHALIENSSSDRYKTGQVTVAFNLHWDGRVSDVLVKTNSANEAFGLSCQKAILDPQPYEHWSKEMRIMIPNGYRQITFSFSYH